MIIEGSKDIWVKIKPDHTVCVSVGLKGSNALHQLTRDLRVDLAAIEKAIPYRQEDLARPERIRLLKAFYAVQEECLARATQTTTNLVAKISTLAEGKFYHPVFDQATLSLTFGTSEKQARRLSYAIEGEYKDALDLALPQKDSADIQRVGNPCWNVTLHALTWNETPYKDELQVKIFAPDSIQGTNLAALKSWASGTCCFDDHAYQNEAMRTEKLVGHLAHHLRPHADKMALC